MSKYKTTDQFTINHNRIKNKIQRTDTISNQNHNVYKGIQDGQTKMLKVVKINSDDLDWYIQIIDNKITQHQRSKKIQSCFSKSNIFYEHFQDKKQLYLRITAPYIYHQNLEKYIRKLQDQSFDRKCITINTFVKKLIEVLIQAPNNIMYSMENLFWNVQSQKIELNWTSFAGLGLMTDKNQSISLRQFKQILQLLDSTLFDQTQVNHRFSIKLKVRAIGVVILSFILGKRVSFLFSNQKLQTKLQKKEVIKLIKKSESFIASMLVYPDIKNKILQVEKQNKVNYLYFLNQVFREQKDLTWTQVINYLIPKFKYQKIDNRILSIQNIAAKLFQNEDDFKKRQYNQRGIGLKDLNIYMVIKLKLSVSLFYGFDSLEDYFSYVHPYSMETDMVFQHTLNFLISSYNFQNQISLKDVKEQNYQNLIQNIDNFINYLKRIIQKFTRYKTIINFKPITHRSQKSLTQ